MVIVEEGAPNGDLYELEQSTYYRVLDKEFLVLLVDGWCRQDAALCCTGPQFQCAIRAEGGWEMNMLYPIAGIVALGLLVYLCYALLAGEKL